MRRWSSFKQQPASKPPHSAAHAEKQLPLTMATTLTSSSSSSSSPRCVPFAFRRGGERRSRGLPPPLAAASRPSAGCGRPLCRAAEVVGGGIRGAFFASLDGCSCVEVRTKHDDSFRMLDADADDPEAITPLIMRGGAPSSGDDDSTAAAAAAGGHGRRRRKLGSKQRRRGGLGCCDANSTNTVN
ncbi:hypothetical protein HU200_032829 [Digitaria exilis]|uniref:Uncharacterized protein n=1 Tax=Digitaria exilis TaxID=1010633 RepID=A0A835EQ40_9POAL|nr:hypothetical protein HU200_032829 [Digitaria exilis]